MKKNLFLAGSPLQVINALEAIHHFKLENIVFIIRLNKMKNNINQIEQQIIAFDDKIEIIRVHPSGRSKFLQYVENIRYLKKYEYDKVFLGEFNTFSRILISNLKKNKVFLIDDGTATIVDYERYIKPNKINKFNFRELRFILTGLKIKVKDKINYFTYYSLEKLPGTEVIKNNLEYMRQDFIKNSIDYSDTIFFFGQPSVIFSDKNELKIDLEKIAKKFIDKKILYIPHRRQTKEEIDNIRLIKNSNIEILELNKPVERYFLDNGIYPKYVMSYVSTALTTTKILFPECNVDYIKIKYTNSDYLDYLYFYFEKDNITELIL